VASIVVEVVDIARGDTETVREAWKALSRMTAE
jgi:hypothetical protein